MPDGSGRAASGGARALDGPPPGGSPTSDRDPTSLRRPGLLAGAALVFALALAARLVPVLQGGGLHGLGNYDDAVHYAATVALVEGRLPYRDFLLLHPPGILVLLSPFAALGGLIGDADAMAVARISWMVLGAVNALLVGRVLLPLGASAALVGAVGYAVYFPAVYSEHTLLLESPATTCLLVSLVLLRVTASAPDASRVRVVVAGAVLGAAITLKIWGVVPVAVVMAWFLLRRRGGDSLRLLAGGVAVCVVICLPFFLADPAAMWQMVVLDQVGRRPLDRDLADQVSQLVGVSLWTGTGASWMLGLALVVGAAAVLATLLGRRTRLLGVLLVALVVLVMSTPSWFLHYAALTAAPAALVLGAAVGMLADRARSAAGPALSWVVTGIALLAALGYASPLLRLELIDPFPRAALARALAGTPGCVATDDPGTLIETDLLRRNLDRGCRVEIDLGGMNYHLDSRVSRARNPAWQQYCLDYYRSSDAVISVRFRSGFGYSRATARTYTSWPELTRAGSYVVRVPQPDR